MLLKVLVILLISAVTAKVLDHDYPAINPRIINGQQALPGQFPWQVMIKKSENDDISCGGTIISPDWVLTAAHCLKDGKAGLDLKSVFMVFGTININEKPVSLTSTELYYKSDFNPMNYNNDIAVVKLPKSLTFNDNIQSINLVKRSAAADTFVDTNALVSGWGDISDEDPGFSDHLLYANMHIITNDKCKEIFGDDSIKSSTICAQGSESGHESVCSGDSGGGLVIHIDGKPVQIGINSFVAEGACSVGHPAAFTRVGSFLDYIENTTGIKLE